MLGFRPWHVFQEPCARWLVVKLDIPRRRHNGQKNVALLDNERFAVTHVQAAYEDTLTQFKSLGTEMAAAGFANLRSQAAVAIALSSAFDLAPEIGNV